VDRQASKSEHERSDGADAFIPASAQISGTSDDLAEFLAEQYLREASGDESEEEAPDDVVSEELGPLAVAAPDEGAEDEPAEKDPSSVLDKNTANHSITATIRRRKR
jgi:hypothetical protein